MLKELNTGQDRRQDNGEDCIQGRSEESSEESSEGTIQQRNEDMNKDEIQDCSIFLGTMATTKTMRTPEY